MPDQIESYKLICSGGLNSNENHLDLSENFPGEATRLVNYEPSLFGGYRVSKASRNTMQIMAK